VITEQAARANRPASVTAFSGHHALDQREGLALISSAITAVLLPVDTLSGEIASGVIQTLAAKPIRRGEIVLGKWLGHGLVLAVYFLLTVGGVLVVARVVGHFTPPHVERGLPLLFLEAVLLLTVAIAGGTRLSTITNGMMAFGSTASPSSATGSSRSGTFTDNVAARNVGTVSSLIHAERVAVETSPPTRCSRRS